MVGQQVIHDASQEVGIGGELPQLLRGNAGEFQERFQAGFIGRQKTKHLQGYGFGVWGDVDKFFDHFRGRLTTSGHKVVESMPSLNC